MKLSEFNWISGIFIIGYHIALFILLPVYLMSNSPGMVLVTASVVLWFITGISISAGYHRFYSHKAYNASKILEIPLLFFGTMALEGSALWWSSEHRKHHRFTDKEEDPYSISKGFLYAHILWIFKKPAKVEEAYVPDLMKNKLVVVQHRFYGIFAVAANLMALAAIYYFTGDLFGTFVIAFLARVFLLHHFTWFINSLAHTWGAKTYSEEQSAVDNYIVALVTFGEGYHNYHHVFASDYRNGIKWYHFDPSKWLLWTANKIGLAKDLRKISSYTIRKTIIMEDKKILLEKLKESPVPNKAVLEARVIETSEKIMQKINELNQIMHQYTQSKEISLKKKAKEFSTALNKIWEDWKSLSRQVMSLPSA